MKKRGDKGGAREIKNEKEKMKKEEKPERERERKKKRIFFFNERRERKYFLARVPMVLKTELDIKPFFF